MKYKIVIACRDAVATSTMVTEEIEKLRQNHNISAELAQCRANEIETYMDSVYLVCVTAKVDRSFSDILLVRDMPFIFGIDIEAL